MKRILILLVLFLTACARPGTQPTLTQTPALFSDTVPAPVTDPPGSPPLNVGVTATLPPASPAVSDAKTFPDPTAYKWTDIVSGLLRAYYRLQVHHWHRLYQPKTLHSD